MYHPYKNGYSVLPGLHRLGNEPIFQVDECLDEFLTAKRTATHQPYHEHNLDPKVMSVVCQFLNERLLSEHPCFKPTFDFSGIAMQIQEDLVIHQIAEDKDWMSACHVSLPSHWCPSQKIGKSFEEIHGPVPGMKSNRPLVSSMLKGPYYRFVWGVVFGREINSHPNQPRRPYTGEVWAKVERQIIFGFPELNAVLFVIRPHLVIPDMPALKKAVLAMTPEQWTYKEIPAAFIAAIS